MRPCQHADTTDGCHLCRLYDTSPKHRAFWDGLPIEAVQHHAGGKTPLPVLRPACVHEGTVMEWCTTCSGVLSEHRHIRDCDLYERCTRGRLSPQVRSCLDCPDYLPAD